MGRLTYVLAIDQGTTSTRALIFDSAGRCLATGQKELTQHFPQPAWVEHDAEEIFSDTLLVIREALAKAGIGPGDLAAIGITNQRETVLLWDRRSGRPLSRAIVWQDRRTAAHCAQLRAEGHEKLIAERTGLVIDPYFSATKLAWALEHHGTGAADLCAGTIDSWLLFRLTGGRAHATDATNAARTMLFDIERQVWDDDLLRLFGVPASILPEVRDSADEFGVTDRAVFGAEIPIAGIAGDQQAATLGQFCLEPGMIKSTYGTGCFALINTGARRLHSSHRLLATIAYRLAGKATYALEGSIFVAGAAVQWLRDGLRFFERAEQSNGLAASANPSSEVIMVPAFVGLGAPYWDAEARGAILGLTRDSGPAEITRAALESVAFQTRDLIDAMGADLGTAPVKLRVDGGMAASDFVLQAIADVTGLDVERPANTETTAFGAALLAGLQRGIYPPLSEMAGAWALEARFRPKQDAAWRDARYGAWRRAVRRVLS